MNELITYSVPAWLKIAFLLAIPAPLILTTFLVRTAFSSFESNLIGKRVGLFFLLYAVYVVSLGGMGTFRPVFFPPMVLLWTTFPFAFFLFLYVARTKYYRMFLEKVALDKLVGVHIFRLIGVFFLLLYAHEALPKWFALLAGGGDILTALASIWVARLIRQKHPNFRTITLAWNTFGLIDILFTAVSANVLTKLSIERGIMGVDALAMFPFYFIPALAPPLIIFLHYATYQKLKK